MAKMNTASKTAKPTDKEDDSFNAAIRLILRKLDHFFHHTNGSWIRIYTQPSFGRFVT
jgi:hypothetical protein